MSVSAAVGRLRRPAGTPKGRRRRDGPGLEFIDGSNNPAWAAIEPDGGGADKTVETVMKAPTVCPSAPSGGDARRFSSPSRGVSLRNAQEWWPIHGCSRPRGTAA